MTYIPPAPPVFGDLASTNLPSAYGLPSIQPFTYRSTVTYQEMLESLRVYVQDTLIPYLNEAAPALAEYVVEALATQTDAYEAAISAALTAISTGQIQITDPAVNAVLNATVSNTRNYLDGRYARKGRAPVSQRIALLGDSLTGKGGQITGSVQRNVNSFWTWGFDLLNQSLELVGNYGVDGNKIGDMIARLPTITAGNVGWCHVLGGTNDIATNIPTATSIANLNTILDTLTDAGIRVVLGTIPPITSGTAGQLLAQATLNNFIRAQQNVRSNVIVADYEAALVDDTSGQYWAGYSTDGVHNDTPKGAFAAGQVFANTLRPFINTNAPMPANPLDPTNLLGKNGRFFLGDGNVNTGWKQQNYTAVPAASRIARTDGVGGFWQQEVVPNGDHAYFLTNVNVSAGMAIGDSVEALIEYQADSFDGSAAATTTFFCAMVGAIVGGTFDGANERFDLWSVLGAQANTPTTPRAGVFRTPPLQIPAGTTQVQVGLWCYGGAQYRFGRAVLRKV